MRVRDPLNLTDLDLENIENSMNALAEQLGVSHWFEFTVERGDGTGWFSYTAKKVPALSIIFDMAVDEIIDMVIDAYGMSRSAALIS